MLRDIFSRPPKITNRKMYTWLNHSQNFNPKLDNVSFSLILNTHNVYYLGESVKLDSLGKPMTE